VTSTDRIRAVAAETFGHADLLPGQADAIRALADDRDVLLVSPTGAGKSLVYQVAGVLREGCTVVVSPLLALQQDQIESIEAAPGGLTAARLSSAESEAQQREVLERAAAGGLDFLLLSPEQLANDVRAEIAALRPGLVAVDEAHCVSVWGHDFRPDYFRLGELVADLGTPRIAAMTATAAPPVRDDIVDRLGMTRAETVVTGFARPNLALDVVRVVSEDDQRDVVVKAVADGDGPGIVYCRTRPMVEAYAELLGEHGRRVLPYHAGLGHKRRREAHQAFSDAETDRCRAEFLVGYFGEQVDRCGACDNCEAGLAPASVDDGSFPPQARVEHDDFGPGVVTDVEDDRLTVLFDDVGYRTLSRELVEEEDLLRRDDA